LRRAGAFCILSPKGISIAYLLDDLQVSLEKKFRTLADTLAELHVKVRDMQLAY
jgi:hypothetical protein